MPERPGFGTQGKQIMLWTNSFPLAFKGDLQLYRYSVEILSGDERGRVPTGKKVNRVIQLLLEDHFAANKRDIATDFKSNLISKTQLELQDVYEIRYRSEYEDEIPENSPTYRCRLQATGTLSTSELINYLTSSGVGAMLRSKEEIIQGLNIVMGHTPKASTEIASIGQSKHYKLAATETFDLGAGLKALQGFFFSVRAATARVIVNVQVKNAAFYEDGPLERLMYAYTEENGSSKVKLGNFLKRVSVRLTHIIKKDKKGRVVPRMKTIAGVATRDDGRDEQNPPIIREFGAGPKDVQFFLGGAPGEGPAGKPQSKGKGKKPAKAGPPPPSAGGRYITVYDFFRETYNITIKDPSLPVINVGTRQRPSYLPADVCQVLPGQPSNSKLSPSQTQRMIRFAVRKPAQNAQSIITSGVQTLGLESADSTLDSFGMQLTPKLMTVPGRVLNCPDVKYAGNKVIKPRFGSWNMVSIQFASKTELPYWTYLWLSYPNGRDQWRDEEGLKPTIDAFTDVLRQTGINAINCVRGQRATVRSEQDIDNAVQNFARAPKPPKFILVILPAADSAIYNQVKYACDVQAGIPNVCVVAQKFAKPNNAQYFANVALKFNLKLGGRNQVLDPAKLGVLSEGKTMVVGIDVTHPSPGSASNAPSVAAIVASVDRHLAQWPADLRVQTARQEMVSDLDTMLKSRLHLWMKHNGSYPQNILVYRDGVSEGQYDQVLDKELPALRKACKELYPATSTSKGFPKITIVVVGKRHHHRFYPTRTEDADRSSNPQNGTVVDRGVTEAWNWDFFLQAHTALQGTARPAHYYIVYDEIFRDQKVQKPFQTAADALEDVTHNLCYLFGRATKAVSICPPAYYADLVCERARCYMSGLFDPSLPASPATSVTGDRRGPSQADSSRVRIHENVRDAMFYI
ncbi:hypothetical protein ASPWEDRAFT_285619 [Aspergillus wentii DTO 134E9]|uniref:Piwi domain-containing protein n=1 Tax=Aspergillus wentii DTO 134E9 TaxID=1073089 RepID=A0A1L9S3M8_ASPWE|nr:uncharacterized protein ASPWEDRAFT_285619 [Aspergillus wentii DTO 134E9]OJJ41764.1 hypothetical protein ASPWEDRAFT_285619 [Aspergillus wentii DTO 134E9]